MEVERNRSKGEKVESWRETKVTTASKLSQLLVVEGKNERDWDKVVPNTKEEEFPNVLEIEEDWLAL